MKKYAYLTISDDTRFDNFHYLDICCTELKWLEWLVKNIKESFASSRSEKVHHFRSIIQFPYDQPKRPSLNPEAQAYEVYWWVLQVLCQYGWEPLGSGQFRKEVIQED